jgi:hypothetical protein
MRSPVLEPGDDLLGLARRYVGVGEEDFFALLEAEVGNESVLELAARGERVDLGRWLTPAVYSVGRRDVMRRASVRCRRSSAKARRARAARSALMAGSAAPFGRGASGGRNSG